MCETHAITHLALTLPSHIFCFWWNTAHSLVTPGHRISGDHQFTTTSRFRKKPPTHPNKKNTPYL